MLVTRHGLAALAAAGVLGVAAHAVAFAGCAPGARSALDLRAIAARSIAPASTPAGGLTPGPVTVAGYAEPSLVFALGHRHEVGDDVDDAADDHRRGPPGRGRADHDAGVPRRAGGRQLRPTPAGAVQGFDYLAASRCRPYHLPVRPTAPSSNASAP